MGAGFFNPKDPGTYNNTVIPSFSDLVLKYDGVDQLDLAVAVNSQKNENRIKTIYEEDMGILTADVQDPVTGIITPSDLDVVFAHSPANDEVIATITKVDSLIKYDLIGRLIRILFQNLQDDVNIFNKMAAEFIAFTEKLKLDPATPWIIDGNAFIANFPILGSPYPDNDGIPDNDNVYRNMIAHRIQSTLGFNIISNDFLWIEFIFEPTSGTATHFRMKMSPTSKDEREQTQQIVQLIGASAASGTGASGIVNQYRFLHFAGDALRIL